MAGFLPLDRRTIVGGLIFIFFLWTLSSFTQTTTYITGAKTTAPQSGSSSGDGVVNIPEPNVSLPPWYDGEDAPPAQTEKPAPPVEDSSKADNEVPPPKPGEHLPPTKSVRPSTDTSSSSDERSRPLILYSYTESEATRENLDFFIKQGLHGQADFIFILNGETNATDMIPNKPNIKIEPRPNTCSDLGAFGEVLRKDELWKKYKYFITMNASIRGPFLPYWSQQCWSDMYLDRITEKVKLVGMTANCWPQFHVQSLIWATDSIGMELLLNPPPGSSTKDDFGDESDPIAFGGCYDGWHKAVHAEVGTTPLFTQQGYEVDLMMMAFHMSKTYIADCDTSVNGDVLWNGKYFGANVHPYETIFIRSNRDIDPTLIRHLTDWHIWSGMTSWDTCGVA